MGVLDFIGVAALMFAFAGLLVYSIAKVIDAVDK